MNSFGSVDADADPLLEQCFEVHRAYEQAVSKERFLLLGRKGTGKTAIFRRLKDAPPPNSMVLGFTHRDYPWPHHELQTKAGTPTANAYVQSWTYLMLLSWARLLINDDPTKPRGAKEGDALRALRRFVIDSYGTTTPRLSEIFARKHTLQIHPEFGANIGAAKLSIKPQSVSLDHLPRHFNEINRALAQHVFDAAQDKRTYYLAFDELDQDYTVSSEEYRQRVIGLIQAARILNNDARRAKANVFSIVFLRDDIFDNLSFNDKNKVFQTEAALLEWDTPRATNTLQELMDRRFTEALKATDVELVAWKDIFSGDQMTSRRTQYRYILDRTFFRPRDMIQYCNEMLTAHKRRIRQDETTDARFTKEDVFAARERYSDYLRRELEDEMFVEAPEWDKYLGQL